MTPEERKEYAKRILENPLWDEAFNAAKDGLYREMSKVDLTDRDSHQAIIVCAQWLDTVKRYFENQLQAVKVTQFNLAQRKQVI